MRALSTLLFVLAAIVNLIPVSGVSSSARLQVLYGIPFEGADLEILMRHRAVLFGIVGALLLVAAFHPPLRPIGLAVGLVSMLSFVAVAYLVGGYNAELQRVVWIDIVASGLLLVGAALGWLSGES